MDHLKAYKLGVRAEMCTVVDDASRHDGWRVVADGRTLASHLSCFAACRWVARLRRLGCK